MSNKNTIVLSGTGTSLGQHIGFLRVLEERNISISSLRGTSGGAIISSLYAINGSSNVLERELSEINLTDYIDLDFNYLNGLGFIKGDKLLELFKELMPVRFKDLSIPLSVFAVDFDSKELIEFSNIFTPYVYLYDAVRCSISLPIIFKLYDLNMRRFVDGGLKMNLPVVDNSICHYVRSAKGSNSNITDIIFGSIMNVFDILLEEQILSDIERANNENVIITDSTFSGMNFFYNKNDFSKMIIEGYNSTMRQINEKI
jgi:hypothetical protein